MPERSEPPPALRWQTDLDGLHVEVGAYRHTMTEATRRRTRTALLLLGPIAWVLAALLDRSLAGLTMVACFVTWLLLDDVRLASRRTHRLTLGPRELHVADTREAVRWEDVGEVRVLDGDWPVLEVLVHGRAPLRIPMELEPPAHARWLADTVMARGREAREARGSSVEVPKTLRTVRDEVR
ncbi:MAG: hypothetical protein KC656_20255, partial [Myxococcales bacterium]|nr:hypothetical protein [Myxococcales bacterium]